MQDYQKVSKRLASSMKIMPNDKITEAEIETTTKILKKIEPGTLPFPIFLEIARLYVSCIVEIVPLYNDNGKIQVLLQTRGREDPIWGGKLHTTGTVIRANDEDGSFKSAFDRILNKELAGIAIKKEPTFVKSILHQVARGKEFALVFYVELLTDKVSHLGRLYDIEKMPNEIVDTQIQFIQDAARQFIEQGS
jgi:hypothetical protein